MHSSCNLEIKTVAAFLSLATAVHFCVHGQGKNTHEGATGKFAGFAGGDVFRIAGDVERFDAVFFGERQEQSHAARGVMMATERCRDIITDVAEVLHSFIVADAQIDPAHYLPGLRLLHDEFVFRVIIFFGVSGESLQQFQMEFSVGQRAGVEERKILGHVILARLFFVPINHAAVSAGILDRESVRIS